MLEWIKYSFWNFGTADFSHGISGQVGQVTHCKVDGIEFWTRENTNGMDTFLISSAERWGEKAGAKPRKERQSLELYVPNPELWDKVAEVVKANDPVPRGLMQNKEFNKAWIDKFLKSGPVWTWNKQYIKAKNYL
jgi:hypothetical protein